jgi:hypothetical protein
VALKEFQDFYEVSKNGAALKTLPLRDKPILQLDDGAEKEETPAKPKKK